MIATDLILRSHPKVPFELYTFYIDGFFSDPALNSVLSAVGSLGHIGGML
jgi:hypothetical protein